jgi:hypothetical protein
VWVVVGERDRGDDSAGQRCPARLQRLRGFEPLARASIHNIPEGFGARSERHRRRGGGLLRRVAFD